MCNTKEGAKTDEYPGQPENINTIRSKTYGPVTAKNRPDIRGIYGINVGKKQNASFFDNTRAALRAIVKHVKIAYVNSRETYKK